jgi:hypothetical protein
MQDDSFDLAAVTAAAGVDPCHDLFARHVYSWRPPPVALQPHGGSRSVPRSWRSTGRLTVIPEAGTARCSAIIPDGTGNLAVVEDLILDNTATARLATCLRAHSGAIATAGDTSAAWMLGDRYAALIWRMTPATLAAEWDGHVRALDITDAPATPAQPVAPVDRLLHPGLPFMYYAAWPEDHDAAVLFFDGLSHIRLPGSATEANRAVELLHSREPLLRYPDDRWDAMLTVIHALAVVDAGVSNSAIGRQRAAPAAIALSDMQQQILSRRLSMPEACQQVVAILDPSCPNAHRIAEMSLGQQRLTTTIAALAFLARAGETQHSAILDPASIERATGRALTGDGNPYVIRFRHATFELRIHGDLVCGHATLSTGTELADFPFALRDRAFASVCTVLERLERVATPGVAAVPAALLTRFREPWIPPAP